MGDVERTVSCANEMCFVCEVDDKEDIRGGGLDNIMAFIFLLGGKEEGPKVGDPCCCCC
jgi:hypothetical protein